MPGRNADVSEIEVVLNVTVFIGSRGIHHGVDLLTLTGGKKVGRFNR